MKKAIVQTLVLIGLAAAALAQQPQTQTAPSYPVNAKYVNGVAPGYRPTAGSGLTLNVSAGTAFCGGAAQTYAGGTLTMTASTTNYVYLNTSSSCAPAVKTTAFTSSDIPVATVVTGSSSITSITDDRTMFQQGGNANGITALTGDVTASGPGSAPATLATVNSAPGTCGDATHVCQATTDGKGRVTSQAAVAISGFVPSTGGAVTGSLSNPYGSVQPSGGNWYVDAANGNDSNTGLSSSQAFATIRRALADNQLLYSQQFDVSSYWIVYSGSISANASGVGDGTVDAYIPDATNGGHGVALANNYPLGSLSMLSVCMGPDGYTAGSIIMSGSHGVGFNLSSGTAFALTGYTLPPLYGMIPASTGACGPSLVSAANWYRVWAMPVSGANNTVDFNALAATDGSTSFSGNGTSGIYLWGAEGESVDWYQAYGPGPYLQTGGLPATTLQSNQVVSIDGGSQPGSPLIYRESIYIGTVTGITLQGYGTNRPVIAADNLIAPSAWTLTTGTTYQATETWGYEGATIGNEWINLYDNGQYTVAATSLANCEATPGTYFISGNNGSLGTGSITIYYNPSYGASPSAHTVEYSAREYAISFDANGSFGITLNHIATRRNIAHNGSIQIGDSSALNDVEADDGTYHNIYTGKNSTITNSRVNGAYYGPGGTPSEIVMYDPTGTGVGTLTINGLDCAGYVTSASAACIYGHTSSGSGFGSLTATNVHASYVLEAISGGFSSLAISNFTCQHCYTGISLTGNQNLTLSNCSIQGPDAYPNSGAPITLSGNTSPVTISISNCVLMGGASGGNAAFFAGNGNGVNLSITNSTLVATNPVQNLLAMGYANSTLVFTGNTVDVRAPQSPGSQGPAVYSVPSSSSFTANNNHYLGLSGSWTLGYVNGTAYTLPQIQSTFSQEANSTYP